MANKKTPAEIRKEAKKLLDKACEMENQVYQKVGKIVFKHYQEKFSNFNPEAFKREASEILKCLS